MRIIGIDPGYHRCGYGVIEGDCGAEVLLASGVIETEKGSHLALRLHALALELDWLLKEWQPEVVAVEEIYFSKNVKTAIGVAHARGVVLEHCAALAIPVAEFTPTMIKSQLTGNGRADKKQVEFMVRKWIKVTDEKKLDDELDAIATALCYSQRSTIPEAMQ